VKNAEIKPNPAKKTDRIFFNATFEDLDSYDIARYELWSSIDGLLDYNIYSINSSDKCYESKKAYNYSISNFNFNTRKILSEGEHTIIFKLYDKSNQNVERALTLRIDDFYLGFFPKNYTWTLWCSLLAGLTVVVIELLFKKKPLISNENNMPILLQIVFFIFLFFFSIYVIIKIFKYPGH
jgi:hypothetical protein